VSYEHIDVEMARLLTEPHINIALLAVATATKVALATAYSSALSLPETFAVLGAALLPLLLLVARSKTGLRVGAASIGVSYLLASVAFLLVTPLVPLVGAMCLLVIAVPREPRHSSQSVSDEARANP